MKKRDPLEDISRGRTEALERRRELLTKKPASVSRPEQPQRRQSAPPAQAQPAAVAGRQDSVDAPAFIKSRYSKTTAPFLLGGSKCVPGYGLTLLTNELLDSAEKRDVRTLLVWPGIPSSLALAHCTATIHRWTVGDKLGLRTLWYPVVASTAYGIRPLTLEREAFLALTSQLAESTTSDASHIARSLPSKDSLFFSVAGGETGAAPTMGELIPQFFSTQGISGWTSFEKRYVRGVSRELSISRRKAIRATAAELGTPDSAPDAWFGIGLKETAGGIQTALKMLRQAPTALDVIIVCITRKVRQQANWRKNIELFLSEAHSRFSHQLPGVVVLCDEPVSYSSTVKYLLSNLCKRTGWPKDSKRGAILWPHDGWDLRQINWKAGTPPEPRAPHVRVVDAASGRAVEAVDGLLHDRDLPEEVQDQLEDLQLFFTQLSNMCARREQLEAWIQESANRERVSSTDHWLSHKARLVSLIESGSLGSHRDTLEEIKNAGDRLWAASGEGLPLVRAVEDFVNENAGRTTSSMLLFANERERELARRYLGQLTLANGKAFTEVQHRFRFALPWTFDEDVRAGEPRRLLIAGASRRQLTIALTRNAVPNETTIVMPLPTAEYLSRAFSAALECEKLRMLKPRLETLLRDIKTEIGRLGRYKGASLNPDRVFAVGEAGDTVETVARDHSCWLFILESGRSIQLGRTASAFRFEPGARKSLEQSFARVSASELEIGDGIVTNSATLRAALDDTLRAHGIPGLEAVRGEELVAYYKKEVNDTLDERFPGKTTAERSRLILAEMKKLANLVTDLPVSIEYWISRLTQRAEAGQFEPPRSAGSFEHFKIFSEVLGFDERDTRRNWRAVQQLRIGHQQAGRQMSSMWQDLIIDSTEFLVSKGIPRAELDHLLQLVIESVETVATIQAPEKS